MKSTLQRHVLSFFVFFGGSSRIHKCRVTSMVPWLSSAPMNVEKNGRGDSQGKLAEVHVVETITRSGEGVACRKPWRPNGWHEKGLSCILRMGFLAFNFRFKLHAFWLQGASSLPTNNMSRFFCDFVLTFLNTLTRSRVGKGNSSQFQEKRDRRGQVLE